jgi:outer membrane protein OmpA-like peptidoglycan-associated protein
MLKLLEPSEHKTPAAYPSPSSTVVPASTNTALQLTPVQKQQAQTELAQLQGQLKTLSDGVAALESQVGISGSDEAIEARLQAIAMELEGVAPPSANSQSVENSTANNAVAVSESISQTDKLKVTLPSDLLFDRSNSILRSEAGLILDKIVADLRGYPSSTIRIGAYTDINGEAEDNRELSFRRAKAVEQYLARTLGTQYRWLVIGYGETRPLVANDTGANQQRNRRVEIAVN